MNAHLHSLTFECRRIQAELCKVDCKTMMGMQECFRDRVNYAVRDGHIDQFTADHLKHDVGDTKMSDYSHTHVLSPS